MLVNAADMPPADTRRWNDTWGPGGDDGRTESSGDFVAAPDGRADRPRRHRHRRQRRRRIGGTRPGGEQPTVGKFVGIITSKSLIVGMVTEVGEEGAAPNFRKVARLDLIGEILPGGRFQRGVTEYPNIGDSAQMLAERELRQVYGAADGHAHIGDLQQNPNIGVQIDIDNLVSRHFAVLGATGVGKSSGVAIILQKILDTRPNLRIFLLDPHNEYGRCFGDKAQVLNPRNLRLPFWLFNFEEIVDAFFGGRPGVDGRSRNPRRSHSARQGGLSAIPQHQQSTACSPSAAIRRMPASPPTRRCPTASRT